MRRSCASAALAKAVRRARMKRVIAFLLPKSHGHYAIGRDPVVLVLGEAEVAAEPPQALAQLRRGGEVLQHLVARPVGKLAGLIGVSVRVGPGNFRTGPFHVAVVHESDRGAVFKGSTQTAQKLVDPAQREMRPPEPRVAGREF